MALICPGCSTAMQAETYDGVDFDVCPQCTGIWCHPNGLHDILARDRAALTDLEKQTASAIEQQHAGPSTYRCPACDVGLEQYNYLYDSPILLHSCPACGGIWIENGELAKMDAWLQRSRSPAGSGQDAALAIAQATMEHDAVMSRQQALRGFFQTLNRQCSGWIGLIP